MDLMKELENMVGDLDIDRTSDTEDTAWYPRTTSDRVNNDNISMLKKLFLPHAVFKQSVQLYEQTLAQFSRVKFKNSIMCASVFLAHSLAGLMVEEEKLLVHFKVDKVKYTKGLRLVKTVNQEIRSVKITVNNDLYNICCSMDIVEDYQKIIDYIDNNLESVTSPRSSAKAIRCAMLYAWLFANKAIIPDSEAFASVCKLSSKSIQRVIVKNPGLVSGFISKELSRMTRTLAEKYSVNPFQLHVDWAVRQIFL